MNTILSFLKSLSAHNDREWFNAHKHKYLEVKEKVDRLTEQLLVGIQQFEPGAASLTPPDCLYRIYRDTRFSADKTPYKTHIGIFINPPFGKKSMRCGYYLHIEPGKSLVGAGAWWPDPKLIKAIRQSIFDETDEYLDIIQDPAFTEYYTRVGEDLLKTAPKGFPKDWEHIDLLKPRSFTAMAPLCDEDLKPATIVEATLERMKAAKPLNDFFNYTVEEVYPDEAI